MYFGCIPCIRFVYCFVLFFIYPFFCKTCADFDIENNSMVNNLMQIISSFFF